MRVQTGRPRSSYTRVPDNFSRRRTHAMDHPVVHFEIPADDPERAAKFYRELFGWEISRWGNPAGAGEGPEYWMVRTVPTDAKGQPTRPGVNGGNIFAIWQNDVAAA